MHAGSGCASHAAQYSGARKAIARQRPLRRPRAATFRLTIAVPLLLSAWELINSDRSALLWGPICLASGPVAFLLARRKAPFAAGPPPLSE